MEPRIVQQSKVEVVVRAVIALGLMLAAGFGWLTPDSEVPEEILDAVVAVVGFIVALFTTRPNALGKTSLPK